MVLSPGEFVESLCSTNRLSEGAAPHEDQDETASDVASSIDLPTLSEFLLTTADVLQLKLRGKLGKGKVQKKLATYSNKELTLNRKTDGSYQHLCLTIYFSVLLPNHS